MAQRWGATPRRCKDLVYVGTELVCPSPQLGSHTVPPLCPPPLPRVLQGEGFPTPTDERHCVNSVSIKFEPSN